MNLYAKWAKLIARQAAGLALAVMLFVSGAAAQNGPIKLGVLTDMSSLYADNGGQGSVVAAQMAADDSNSKVLGRPIQIIYRDHQNKADVGAALARRWLENEGVEVVLMYPKRQVTVRVFRRMSWIWI
jgi:branched-chain amino acid transport system substrate-binding protein